ncbi:mannose-1-phosphate guanylyltransferase [Clostridium sp. SYSU_GA19001]|uniref:mannose-1-phosphate guanylyltransferase n=1 Tax=Clostridium caldaquaticum TaxID=2940653 RepID=UPI002077633D|nr:mannose-1-phosphate guanylyltransferase [Clostridium caldaquaticum]MCM8709416.1 mannose-1-phosphate guanylyltransferase [Clostridium caldaquaticum]
MLCALIMAGGKGERFWPLSTEEKPKQFLNLLGKDSMLQMTVKRLNNLIPLERIFVVTGKKYKQLVKNQLPNLLDRNIIIEPIGKNTAPCLALSAFIINKYYKNCTIAVIPADHLIKNENKFIKTLKAADSFIEKNNNSVVTVGIFPNRPETGYGYIKFGKTNMNIDSFEIKEVERFIEKPNLETAVQYVKEQKFLWNSGMFIWKADTILMLTKKYLSKTYKLLEEIAISKEDKFEEVLEENYGKVDSISIDYGIMEKADNIYVIPSDFGWDDVGNWTSLERYREKDKNNNVKNNNCIFYKSDGNIVVTNKKVVLNDIHNLIVVETDEYIMISSKEKEQNIKFAKNTINKEV